MRLKMGLFMLPGLALAALALATLAGSSMIAGCAEKEARAEPVGSGPDGCESFFDRTAACMEDMVIGVSRADVVSMCRTIAQDKGPDSLFVGQLECAVKHESCASFQACADTAKEDWEAGQAGEMATEIRGALESGDIERAGALCRVDPQPALVAAECGRVVEARWHEVYQSLTNIREAALDRGTRVCRELRGLGHKRSGTAEARADTLCREAEAAVSARKAITAAERNVEAGRPIIPAECTRAFNETRRVTTEWAGNRHAAVVDACYVQLGRTVLEKRKDESWCSRHVRTVLKMLDSGPVRDLDLDDLAGPARRVCLM